MTPRPDEVAQIAAKLTKRSARAIVLIGDDWTDSGWGETKPSETDLYSLGWGKNAKLDLVERRIDPAARRSSSFPRWQWRLSPLGLAVRAHLIEQDTPHA